MPLRPSLCTEINNNNNNNNNNNLICIAPVCAKKTSVALIKLMTHKVEDIYIPGGPKNCTVHTVFIAITIFIIFDRYKA